jgi:subtilase family serine protease
LHLGKCAAAAVAAALLVLPASARAASHRVCGDPEPLHAACLAEVVTTAQGSFEARVQASPSGYGPADLQSAYGLTATAGAGKTIAIVDAYDDPTAEADLAAYRSQFGLPACTSASGCFRKVDENGGTALPPADAGWAQEISLDLDMVSATCPACQVLLVEASSDSFASLSRSVDEAAALGASAISNSYGGAEFSGEASRAYDGHFDHPGIAITVSSGDAGYGVEFPAASEHVTAVGGTTLARGGGARGWTETAWTDAGSGCSAYIAKPDWQHDAGCARRTVADVSAVANPATGVAVYDSTPSQGAHGWMKFGGTSASAPIVAGALAQGGGDAPGLPYANPGALWDITSGSNGSCTVAYLCTAAPGYDGPTGLGTPNGVAAF